MFAPSVSQVMDEFHSTSLELAAFVVSIYLLGYAFGPLFLAPLSELYGRMIIYNVCNVLYLGLTMACAVAPNLAALLVFRLLAEMAGSAPLTIGAGTLADMIRAENRGLAMGILVLGPVVGPVAGPVGEFICSLCSFVEHDANNADWPSWWLSGAGYGLAMDILGPGYGGRYQ